MPLRAVVIICPYTAMCCSQVICTILGMDEETVKAAFERGQPPTASEAQVMCVCVCVCVCVYVYIGCVCVFMYILQV